MWLAVWTAMILWTFPQTKSLGFELKLKEYATSLIDFAFLKKISNKCLFPKKNWTGGMLLLSWT